jgi:hypothetical protein
MGNTVRHLLDSLAAHLSPVSKVKLSADSTHKVDQCRSMD